MINILSFLYFDPMNSFCCRGGSTEEETAQLLRKKFEFALAVKQPGTTSVTTQKLFADGSKTVGDVS